MYISYLRENKHILDEYEYFWIFENDVYFDGELSWFMDRHKYIKSDLILAEYGPRPPEWKHFASLSGFKEIRYIGSNAYFFRMSSRMMKWLVENIDITVSGYLEAILPAICYNFNFSISTFIPQTIGFIREYPCWISRAIESEIKKGHRLYIEPYRIYHPAKC